MKRRTNRRHFLKNTALAGVGVWVAGTSTTGRCQSANEKLNIGIIGSGGRGGSNTRSVSSENIVALCDVDKHRSERAFQQFPKAEKYDDWRKLVDQKDLDAVVVSTTDHTHALACVWAMNRDLSVYCEKPLAHCSYEARVMQEKYLEKKDKIATQMGTQIHATDNYRRLVELVQSGAIGPVREVHVWCGRNGPKDGERPKEEPPVPDHLDWDLWLGPAPDRPFHPRYLPGCTTWEQWWDFGNGCLGDMGSHLIDLPFWALKLRDPLTVAAEGAQLRKETYPEWLVVHWEHPSRGHHQEWIHGAKTGEPTLCNFDYSGKLVEHNLLGTAAFRVGKKLDWDPKTMKAKNCPEADQYIRREYRKGWVLDG